MGWYMHPSVWVEVRGYRSRVNSFLLPCGSQGSLHLGQQAWREEPFPTEPSRRPTVMLLIALFQFMSASSHGPSLPERRKYAEECREQNVSVPCILDHSIPCDRLLWPPLRRGSSVLLGWRGQRGNPEQPGSHESPSQQSIGGVQ